MIQPIYQQRGRYVQVLRLIGFYRAPTQPHSEKQKNKINCFLQTTVGFAAEIDLALKDGFSFLINGVEIACYYTVLDSACVEIDLKVYTFRQL